MTYRLVAEGLGFTEGPLWTATGSLLVVSRSRGQVVKIDVDGGAHRIVASPGGTPTGLAEDIRGDIFIAQGGSPDRQISPSIQRYDGVAVHPSAIDGLNAPNDLAFAPDGALWFTDPSGPAMDGVAKPGRLWRMSGGSGAAECMAEDLLFPNGLAFLPDGDLLVAETFASRVIRYATRGDHLSETSLYVELVSGRPDGLALDARLNLYVAATSSEAVHVYDRAGALVETIGLGPDAFPTNVCFGGTDGRTLFVTSARGGRVYAVPRPTPGLPLHRGGGADLAI